jgi:phospholipid/cholesterol/gamma-HCH transport system ATP-binding protein
MNPLRPSRRTSVIKVRDLKKSFGDNHVLLGFDMDLYDKENLIILGKSGSGKSVLLKCIVGLEGYDSGLLEVLGKNIATQGQKDLDILRSEVGFLFQGSALYDSMTVRENLLFPVRRHVERMRGKAESELVSEVLESVGLGHTEDLYPEELSGGMKRRIALARTLILRPKVILYDEPTTGLDPITSKEIVELMKEIRDTYNTTSLIITHDMDVARVLSDRIIILLNGINYAEGTYAELNGSVDPNVRAFFK